MHFDDVHNLHSLTMQNANVIIGIQSMGKKIYSNLYSQAYWQLL